METTEKIVESYVRYVKGWATIANIKCEGQFEIDLLAVDPRTGDKFHIESGVSVSGSYSKLTAKPFSTALLKKRVEQAGQRRTLGYFVERKFSEPGVMKKLAEHGFKPGKYEKVIVTWGWTLEAKQQADKCGVVLWDFRDLMAEITERFKDDKIYFTDDTLRTLHLYAKSIPKHGRIPAENIKELKTRTVMVDGTAVDVTGDYTDEEVRQFYEDAMKDLPPPG